MAQKGPKRPQNGVKTTPKRPQNDAKMIPKWPQSDPGSTQKWSKITPKSSQNGPMLVPKWPYVAPDRVKMAQKGSKGGQKGPKTVQKSSRPSSNCLKTLKIHPGPFQTHPLTAHFHRLKRRFWPFFQQNKCFIPEKGLAFAQFLHDFGESWPNFAYICLPLHHFA